MSLKRVVAILDVLRLDEVEQALLRHGVRGFTVQRVRGRGSYFNSYTRDPLTAHIQLTTITSAQNAKAVASVIMDAAHTGTDNEGLVSIESIDELFWIHTKQYYHEDEFKYEVGND